MRLEYAIGTETTSLAVSELVGLGLEGIFPSVIASEHIHSFIQHLSSCLCLLVV
jgi:hypothetical protein